MSNHNPTAMARKSPVSSSSSSHDGPRRGGEYSGMKKYACIPDSVHSPEKVTAASREAGLESTNLIDATGFTASNGETDSEEQMPSPSFVFSVKAFSIEDLARATDNFSNSYLLGKGGGGSVFKGTLSDGKLVAVKVLKTESMLRKDFMAEVGIGSRIHHINLVPLVGYCAEGDHRILVSVFIPNKTLDFHLHENGEPTLSWTNRMKIALGSAKALEYLHEYCEAPIIHRDVKPANILIDEKFNPKVADLGLARILPAADANAYYTQAMGTFGYADPSYSAGQMLTVKLDVYSFGVVLSELITGLKPQSNMALGGTPRPSKYLKKHIDKRLGKNFDSNEMARMVSCAAKCLNLSSEERPTMKQVVQELEGVKVNNKGSLKGCAKYLFGTTPINPDMNP